MANEIDLSAVENRARDLEKWIKETAPECLTEQKHLDESTRERVYWHYGYMVALRDVLRLLTGAKAPSQKSCKPDSSSLRSVA